MSTQLRMPGLLCVAMMVLVLGSACGRRGGRGTLPSDAGSPQDLRVSNDAPSETDAGSTSMDSGTPPTRGCHRGCVTASDCVTSDSPLYTEEHWECLSGRCDYSGCASDSECSEGLDGPYICRSVNGGNGCYRSCSGPADCAMSDSPLHTEEHWRCLAGRCDYSGCASDSECSEALDGPYICRSVNGGNGCYRSCSGPADCVTSDSPLYTEEHWQCVSGRCDYHGCANDSECMEGLDGDYICR